MKTLALVTCLFVTSIFASEERHYVKDEFIRIENEELKLILGFDREAVLYGIHSDELGFFVTESDIKDVYIVEKRHHSASGSSGFLESWCGRCGDSFDNRSDRNSHVDDFQCPKGPQGCARQ